MASKPRVLIVDDEDRFRSTLRKLLTVRGAEVMDVASAREAYEAIGCTPFDVVVLDVRMPEINGIEALGEIKKRNPGIEVIILTGHASVDVAVEIMKLGGYEYLLKPCPVEELMLKIEGAFERKTAREERAAGRSPTP